MQKLNVRKATLMKLKSLDERSKQKWLTALTVEMMTSEESEVLEENDGGSVKVYNKRPLTWRADKVTDFFHQLDDKQRHMVSQRSKEMTRSRGEGLPSDRAKPLYLSKYTWLFK